MKSSMLARLIAKDLEFNRSLIIGGTLAGLAAIFLMGASRIVGMIAFVTVVVVCGIFLGLVGVTRERTDKSALFVLSLPVSTLQYTAAKVLSALISFLVPWTVLLTAGIVLSQLDATSAGGLPLFISLMTLLLTNFFVLVTVGIMTTSELWITAAMIGTNLSVPLFFAQSSPDSARASWAPGIVAGFAAEAAIILLCVGLLLYTQSRRKDFV